MKSWAASVIFRPIGVWLARVGNRRIGELLIFTDEVDDIHAESIDPLDKPVPHDLVYCGAYFGVLPVEVWLFGREKVEIILVSFLVVFPSRPLYTCQNIFSFDKLKLQGKGGLNEPPK